VKLGCEADEKLKRPFFPIGWTYLNEVATYRLYNGQALAAVDPTLHLVFPASLQAAVRETEVSSAFPRFAGGQLHELAYSRAHAQTALNLARVACALEEYRLSTGSLPEQLDALWPEYIHVLPHDLVGGGALVYKRSSPTEFLLYSLGWNGEDDQGASRSGADWVWKYQR
jgi:hypothetical protein